MLLASCIISSSGNRPEGDFFADDRGWDNFFERLKQGRSAVSQAAQRWENFFERLKQGRSAVSQAAQRVDNGPELMGAATTTIMEQLQRKVMHR